MQLGGGITLCRLRKICSKSEVIQLCGEIESVIWDYLLATAKMI